MNLCFHEESILFRDIRNLMMNSRIDEKNFSIIPLRSNLYDVSLAAILNVQCNYEFTIDFIDAMDSVAILNFCWVMFSYSTCESNSREHNHMFTEIAQLLEAFGNAHFTSVSTVTSMSCMELAVTIIWLETLAFLNEDIFEKFESKMWLDSLVQGLIHILNDKSNDSTSLVLAISALVFLIEHHKLKSSVLTETNLIQLLNLLLNKMVYPSTDTTLQINNEFEASLCRIGLDQMLKLENFKISEVMKNEILSFIIKWWERIINHMNDPKDTAPFPTTYVLSAFSIMFEKLSFTKEYVCNNCLRCTGVTLFQVLLYYFKSPDISISYIASAFLYQVLFELMRSESLHIVSIQTELCNIEKTQREQFDKLNNIWQQSDSSNHKGERIKENLLINIFQPMISSIQQNLTIINSLNKNNNKLLNASIMKTSIERDEIIELKNRLFAMKTNTQMLQHENHAISDELKNVNRINETKLLQVFNENDDLRRKLSKAEDEICSLKMQYENAIQKSIIHQGLIKDAWEKNGMLNEMFNESQSLFFLHKRQAEINKEKVAELESDLLKLRVKISELQEYEVMTRDMSNIKKQLNDQRSERLRSDQLNQFLQEKVLLYENRMIEEKNMSKSLQIIVSNLTTKLETCEGDKENLKNENIGLEDRIHKQLDLIQTINKLSIVKIVD